MNARILLLMPLMGCYSGAQHHCPKHCWEFTQPVEGVMGEFDGQCQHRVTLLMFPPPLPTPSEFKGSLCLDTQAEHNSVERVIGAVDCGAPGCWNDVDQSDIDIYLELVEGTMVGGGGLGIEARKACMAYLESQDCEVDLPEGREYAVALCNDFVLEPAVAAMTDLTCCSGWIPPHEIKGDYKVTTPYTCDFHPDLATTGNDDGPVCEEGEEGDDDGVDAESGAPLLDNPFGDLERLVDCTGTTTRICVIEPELLANITENFQTFYDEEVWLEMVNITGPGRGAQITGVDSGEDVEELLDAFGIEDEDLITHVNNIHLQGEEDALQAIYEIPQSTAWSVTVRRWNGSSWDTLSYSISVAN